MPFPIYQIDAFTDQPFKGNPASVCPLQEWLPNDVLQNIALENNQAETAFFIPISENRFHLRWFTPEIEMDLCGHATLASAYVLFEELRYEQEKIEFETKSGILTVRKVADLIELDFPSRPPIRAELPAVIRQGLSVQPLEVWKARDYVLVYESEADIRKVVPNVAVLNQINLDPGGIVVTAKGNEVDFVSRFFTPQASIFEDPVTGSAHCTLVPFWANRLQKTDLHALQLSKRSGELFCSLKENRVLIRGKAVKYLEGKIEVPTDNTQTPPQKQSV